MVVRFSHYVQVPVVDAPPAQQPPMPSQTLGPVSHGLVSDSFNCSKDPKFTGGNQQPVDDNVTLKGFFKLGAKVAKKKYQQAKAAVTKELKKPGSEKKAAAVGGLVGFGVAEMATFGTTGGVAGATAASAVIAGLGAKVVQQSNQQASSREEPTVRPIFELHRDSDSDSDTSVQGAPRVLRSRTRS